MSIYPNNNIVNSIYKYCHNIPSNIILNTNNSILKTVLCSVDGCNFIAITDPKEIKRLYGLFNIDIYAATDYIQHSQNRDIHKQYHINELLLLVDPPTPLLKREDLILLSERLSDTIKIIIGSDTIHSSWSFLEHTHNIIPGIPKYKLNTEHRKNLCVLHDGSSSSQKLCQILSQKYPDLQTISVFDNYSSVMETLNAHKVCINLGTSANSLYALYAGCSVISSTQAYAHEQEYKNIEHMIELIFEELSDFDIGKKTDIHNSLEKQYNIKIFTDNILNLISKYTQEPFYI